jgi:hypothetical protein
MKLVDPGEFLAAIDFEQWQKLRGVCMVSDTDASKFDLRYVEPCGYYSADARIKQAEGENQRYINGASKLRILRGKVQGVGDFTDIDAVHVPFLLYHL